MRTPPTLRRTTRVGSLLALARGVPALVFDIVGQTFDGVSFGADAWFVVAGGLGLLLVRRLTQLS